MDYEDDTFDYANLSLCCDSLKILDISGNRLTGDLYDVMAYAPNLKTLKASYNKIRDISNPLPVYTLEFYGQDLRDIYTVNYSDIFNLKGDPQSAVPTVFTYSNKSNSTPPYTSRVSSGICSCTFSTGGAVSGCVSRWTGPVFSAGVEPQPVRTAAISNKETKRNDTFFMVPPS